MSPELSAFSVLEVSDSKKWNHRKHGIHKAKRRSNQDWLVLSGYRWDSRGGDQIYSLVKTCVTKMLPSRAVAMPIPVAVQFRSSMFIR